MSSKKLFINGVRQPAGEDHVILPEQLHDLIILHPSARRPLDPDRNQKDADFIRSMAQKQIQRVIARRNAQDRLEIGPGSRRLRALRDFVNVDPARWGADGPKGLAIKLVTVKDELEMLDMIVAENVERSDPDAVNLAAMASLYLEKGLEKPEVARRLGFASPGRIDQLLELLRHDDRIKGLVQDGRLKEQQARDLLGLSPEAIEEIAGRVEQGEPARVVMRSAREERRKIKPLARSVAEMRTEAKALPPSSPVASIVANLLAYFEGDPTVGTLEDVLLDRPRSKGAA